MKIISLRFANLNSLPGPHLIRFDASPLADTGLFAITGPTGAGKSTLLDAIAVGLYGRVPRHDRQVGEMVSRHAPGAWSEVEFEVHETDADTGQTRRVRYRSRWEVRRKTRGADKGNLNQDEMTLVVSESGAAVVSGKEAVPARVSELSGLDFGQFEQAVLLSQGKFARFLHAPEKERGALLEKMTNVGIYSRLSVAAFEKAKAEAQQTQLLAARLDAACLLPDERRQALESQLAELAADDELYHLQRHELSIALVWRTETDQTARQLAAAQTDCERLRAADEALQPALARLVDHERAAALATPLALADAAEQEAAADRTALADLQAQVPALRQAAETAATAAQAVAATHAAAATEAERLRPVLQAAQNQDAALAVAAAQLLSHRKTHAATAAAVATDEAATHHEATALGALSTRHANLQTWLLAHQREADLREQLVVIDREVIDLTKVTGELGKLETSQAELVKQFDAASRELSRHRQAVREAGQRQHDIRERGKPCRQALAALLRGTSAPALAERAATLATAHGRAQRLLPLAETAQTQAALAVEIGRALAAEAQALTKAETAFQQLEAERTAANLLLESYEREWVSQQQLASLSVHRQHLTAGEPCLLCGSLEHVFAADFAPDADLAARRVADQKTALAALDAVLRPAELSLERRRTEQQQRTRRQAEARDLAAQARQQALGLAAELATELAAESNGELVSEAVSESAEGLVIDAAGSLVSGGASQPPLPADRAALTDALDATALLPDPTDPAAVRALVADLDARRVEAAAQTRQVSKLETEVSALLTEYHKAESASQSAQNQADKTELAQQVVTRDLAKLKFELADLREQAANYHRQLSALLRPHGLSLAADQPPAGVLATLAERADTYQQQHAAREALAIEIKESEAGQQARAQELARRQQELRADAEALRAEQQALDTQQATRRAHYTGADPAAEAERLRQATSQLAQAQQAAENFHRQQQQTLTGTLDKIEQRETDLLRHAQAAAERQTELKAALVTAGLATAEAARALLLPAPEAERLTRTRQQHRTDQQAAQQLLERLGAELVRHQVDGLTSLITSELTAELDALATANDTLQQTLGAVGSQLAQDDAARQQQAAGRRELAQRQLEEQRWQELSEQIGSARGDKFSQFAQGLTLTHLARLANLRLRQLTGRYTILKTPNRNLELQIIDHDQADTVRPMASLSGGESFLVSLALALGLSELAGYKARIESLFIDEGFGTLDPEALTVALDALERLQHSGKMIGIISHVAELKDRIGTQIRVQPGANGNSTVRVVDVVGTETECC